jgi:hypothetical protein
MTTTDNPFPIAGAAIDAFNRLSPSTREAMADTMATQGDPFVAEIGSALKCGGGFLAVALIDAALGRLRWDPKALPLADRLSTTDDPWATLAGAIRHTIQERDQPPDDDLILWPDEVENV